MWKGVESIWNDVDSMWKCMKSMGECMESMGECMESIAEYMEQKHSTWNPPGMWGQGKVLPTTTPSSLERETEGPCCLATALQLTPPPSPSLKHETEGLFCPPPPPLPLSNA